LYRVRFAMEKVELNPASYYAMLSTASPSIFEAGPEWQYDKDDATYPRGVRIYSDDSKETWTKHLNDDHIFTEFGTPPLPMPDPPPPIQPFAPIDIRYTPTWFNEVVKQWLDQKVAGKIPVVFRDMGVLPIAGGLNVKGNMTEESSTAVSGALYYGTSKTALINSKACAKVQLVDTMPITGLTKGVKYYVQYRCTGPAGFIGSNSGIYYGVPT
ncbi:unnamed protein product, partial [marine sediment metagenome]